MDADEIRKAAAEADELQHVHEQPEQPGREAAETHLLLGEGQVDHGDGGSLADGGERAVVEVAERLGVQALHAALDIGEIEFV